MNVKTLFIINQAIAVLALTLLGTSLVRLAICTRKEHEARDAIQTQAERKITERVLNMADEDGDVPAQVAADLTTSVCEWATCRTAHYLDWSKGVQGIFGFGNSSYERFCEVFPSC